MRFQARDVDHLEVKFTRAEIFLHLEDENKRASIFPFNTEGGNGKYTAVVAGAATKEPGRYTLVVRLPQGPTGSCEILRRSVTVAADLSKLTLGLAIGLTLQAVSIAVIALAVWAWQVHRRSEAQVFERWRWAQFAQLERLFRGTMLGGGSLLHRPLGSPGAYLHVSSVTCPLRRSKPCRKTCRLKIYSGMCHFTSPRLALRVMRCSIGFSLHIQPVECVPITRGICRSIWRCTLSIGWSATMG